MKRTVLLLATCLALGCGGRDRATSSVASAQSTTRGASATLPTTAVDAALFPKNEPARFETKGTTFHVATTGDDKAAGSSAAPFRTIRRALEAAQASPGNRVLVRSGTYAEGDASDHRAFVISRERTIVTTAPGEKATVKPALASVRYGLEIAASHVSWRGVSFDGFVANGIAIGVDGKTVEDVVVADLDVTMPAGGDGVAVYPDHRASGKNVVDGLTVANVSIKGADLGFTVGSGPVKSVALERLVVRCRPASGGNSGADAVAFESGDNVLINGLDASGADGDGVDLKATRVAVLDAHVHDCNRNGIKLWLGGDIVNGLVRDCGADASIVLGTDKAGSRYRLVNTLVAFHNRKSGASSYAMTVGYDTPASSCTLELLNTVFHGNTGGISLSKGTSATIRSCLLGPGANGKVLEHGWDGSNATEIVATQDPGALAKVGAAAKNLPFATDPGFKDPRAGTLDGLRPGAASALVNTGSVVAPFPATDLAGAKRVQGSAPDLGPLEAR